MRLTPIATLCCLIATCGSAFADDDNWTVQITPGPSTTKALDGKYDSVYAAIPFSRAEWLANPSYRHDTAAAIVSGQPIAGRTPPVEALQEYASPRRYRRTFFPRLAPADLHYKSTYGWLGYRPYGLGLGVFPY